MSADWVAALRFAALPGAATIVYEQQYVTEDDTPTIKHRLTSYSASGAIIGDDRDYDLLKAVMNPLESLAAQENSDHLRVQLDLDSGHLSGLARN